MTTPSIPTSAPRPLHSTWAPGYADVRPPATTAELDAAVDLLRGHRVVTLTGAGISTDSGIPDYRGPNAVPRSPMTYQQFVGDPGFRRHYWARNHVGWHHMVATSPNDGHRALAALERAGVVSGVITQNVDRLHTVAGSHAVIDLHGHYNEVVCLSCGTVISRAELDRRLLDLNPGFLEEIAEVGDVEIAPDADAVIERTAHFRTAPCERCGGILKPNIVYFGENVPKDRVARAYAMVDDADALLAVGTSLAVQSGLRLVKRAARDGKPVVIVNRGVTRGDELADLRLNAGSTEALEHLLARLS
ncbi:NAD-dependent protein deacetylase [Litorihabitans aurantiacus]|uniref:NAD-dependent protein deacetylase n=1 Tax=Litorihabitans aurantiacus TaxID=1930061 RepID=A0AA37XCP2_9MICO|nr:NAD-dependent protein deacetylase [Litorihabitans aurantiacus]GMA30088.1 NAD-dependent protein deacetylase [Litorihabitans aurantiacus]